MPPVLGLARSRRASAAVPTLLSISKLLRLIPSALNSAVTSARSLDKRAYAQWGLTELATLAKEKEPESPEDPPGSPKFLWKLVLSVCLVLLGGVFAG